MFIVIVFDAIGSLCLQRPNLVCTMLEELGRCSCGIRLFVSSFKCLYGGNGFIYIFEGTEAE